MLSIPDETLLAVPISEVELRQEVAILLYQRGLALGKAGALAGMNRYEFRHLLASRRVPVQYDVEDLEHDLQVLRELENQEGGKASERSEHSPEVSEGRSASLDSSAS